MVMERPEEIIFVVEDDPEGGLTARALGVSIFTEADSMAELKRAVMDALRCKTDFSSS
ncbi:2-oxoisovalerate dehydrogenase [Alkalispirochaeta sphaeroplastigenens]|uniref:2-oxoisovalerate dehydrogenase n=1 Tax=Alkalispirochaeta sphaeroplastigenens TaxID=1187066 RepID=UPI000CDB6A9D|nr:2-oxoisovalerate dehydrogenase [Alkalispirochaeta sphaeroplastigenens]